jgi:hypothetical protein
VRFRLTRDRLLRVAVWQQAPQCRLVGHYVVRAASGTHVLRLPVRVGKRRLLVGTYRFLVTSRGTKVADTRVRVVRVKDRLRIRRDALVDLCPAPTRTASAAAVAAGTGAGAAPPPPAATHPLPAPGRPFLPPAIRNLANPSNLLRIVLFVLIGGSIVLLGTASLPNRMIAVGSFGAVSTRRAVISVTGIALLVAAALVTLVK